MSMLNTTKTTARLPIRALIYGAGGVGKTTFAASWPAPVFLPTEDGANGMGVDAFPICTAWSDVVEHIGALIKEDHQFKTLVIDAVDGVERLILREVLATANKERPGKEYESIGEIPYGRAYVMALEHWHRLILGLTKLRDGKGMRVLLIAHQAVKSAKNPDMDDFDQYVPNLHEKAAGILREWSDLVGFVRVGQVVRESKDGKKRGVSTGQRVLCCQHSAAWFAKNRYAIEQPIPLAWADLATAINDEGQA